MEKEELLKGLLDRLIIGLRDVDAWNDYVDAVVENDAIKEMILSKEPYFLEVCVEKEDNVYNLACLTAEKLGCAGVVLREDVIANCDYVGPGYGLPAKSTLEAIDIFARLEGILLDPVYSGKGAAGLIDLIRKGQFKRGERIVFIHTGGAIALAGYLDSFMS